MSRIIKSIEEETWRSRIKTLILVVVVFVFFSGFGLLVTNSVNETQTRVLEGNRYEVRVSNWIGGTSYYCWKYEWKDGRCYLYDEQGENVGLLAPTEGYVIKIRRIRK